jgi:hypothetical protein
MGDMAGIDNLNGQGRRKCWAHQSAREWGASDTK